VLDYGFAKDINNVYYLGSVVEGVNPDECAIDSIESCYVGG